MKKIFLTVALFLLTFSTTFAAGIGLRPLRTEITLGPGESKTIVLNVINNEDYKQIVMPEFQVYVSHDKSGFPVAKKVADDDPRNISSWIEFENDKVEVEKKSESKVKVKITVPKDAEPGGRYGAIIYGPILPNTQGVSIRTRVASLLLLNVSGEEKFDGELLDFSLANGGKIYSDKAVEFILDFKNKGNIHSSPMGDITIVNQKGEQVRNIYKFNDENKKEAYSDKIPVNKFGNFVLPGLEREFSVMWKENVKTGKNKAKLNFIFKKGDKSEEINREINFSLMDELVLESFEFINEGNKSYLKLKIKNNGNVFEKLKGSIDVLNEFDYKVGEVVIPNDIDYIAPKETKEIKLDFLNKKLPKGKFSLKSNVMYGFENKTLDLDLEIGSKNNLWIYVGSGIVALVIVLLGVIFAKKKKK